MSTRIAVSPRRALTFTGSASSGVGDALPVAAGLAPLGLAVGAAITEAGVPQVSGWLTSPLIYGASAQLAAVSLMGDGAVWTSVVLAVGIVNLRTLLYSAALQEALRQQPRWFRWLAPCLLVDPLFALVSSRRRQLGSSRAVREYYLGAGFAIWACWLPVVALGIFVGPLIPQAIPLAFAAPSLLLALLARAVGTSGGGVAAAVVAAMAFVLAGPLGGLGLLFACAWGTAAGLAVESHRAEALRWKS